ncbi:hypothetical protein EIP91_006954 [Steccherinum ochraceum]|uniref:Uncharacterized protein n=1 Tax=Steccherinum ochraceum TaxID=92696 RepID=A0A4R0R4Z5_9APHY|nr:hypothetical protein EIP91_006954 [Steccherinum ochraceum]
MFTETSRFSSPVLIPYTPFLIDALWQPTVPRFQSFDVVTMHFATILAGILTVTISSAAAVPWNTLNTRGHDENTMMARDHMLVVRDVLNALYARELADSNTRTIRRAASLFERAEETVPNTGAPASKPPSIDADVSPPEYSKYIPITHGMDRGDVDANNNPIPHYAQLPASRYGGGAASGEASASGGAGPSSGEAAGGAECPPTPVGRGSRMKAKAKEQCKTQ